MKRVPRIQRTPVIAISSDEDSEEETGSLLVPSSPSLSPSIQTQPQNSQSVLSLTESLERLSSFQDSFCEDDEDGDDDVYDWLATDASLEKTSSSECEELLSTPSGPIDTPKRRPDKGMHRMKFSPPGYDSPLFDMRVQQTVRYDGKCEVKDTNRLHRVKAQLPTSNMPQVKVVKGNWLTNRVVLNDYILLETLGKGSYGEVRLCKERYTNKLFAIKIISKKVEGAFKKMNTGNPNSLSPHRVTCNDDIKREVAIMKKLRNENIVQLYEIIDDKRSSTIYLVLEYMVSKRY